MSNTVDALTGAMADTYLMRLSEGVTATANPWKDSFMPGKDLQPVSDLLNKGISDAGGLLQGTAMLALLTALMSSIMKGMQGNDRQTTFGDALAALLASLGMSNPSATSGPSQQAMDPAQAFKVLDRNFDKLSGGKESFTDADLQRAAADGSNPELQRAASAILANKSALSGLDTADFDNSNKAPGATQGKDQVYSRGDLVAAMDKSSLSQGDAAAVRTLKDNSALLFDGGKKGLTKDDLQKMAAPDWQPPSGMNVTEAARVQESARFILSKPELMDQLDSAYRKTGTRETGPQLDGNIDLKDVDAMMKSHQVSA